MLGRDINVNVKITKMIDRHEKKAKESCLFLKSASNGNAFILISILSNLESILISTCEPLG